MMADVYVSPIDRCSRQRRLQVLADLRRRKEKGAEIRSATALASETADLEVRMAPISQRRRQKTEKKN
jgi:hypothetical protein